MAKTTNIKNQKKLLPKAKAELNNLQKFPKLLYSSNSASQQEKDWKIISRRHLINILNYINFQDGTILINLKHPKYNKTITLPAKPKPCLNDNLECLWTETAGFDRRLKSYKFLNLLVTDSQELILVKADLKNINEKGICVDLPKTCYEVSSRKMRRHFCEGIQVQFIQNSVMFYGFLLDFSAVSFRVEVSNGVSQSFQWINPGSPVIIIFKDGEDILYSGECEIVSQTCSEKTRTFILKPISNQISRFKPKEFRSIRQKLSPSPNIIFKHPFTKRMINLKIIDLSGAGLSVEEYHDNSVLLPGMIIPELSIEFASGFNIKCEAQVVYRNKGEKGTVKCGLAILNMAVKDQVRLSGILHQAKDQNSYICTRVDLDSLWNFFFETGFIYPEKYAFIEANKQRFKEVYERLYNQNSDIARHFIYQDKGTIHGHMSMVRFYENTWLIHHHAASRSGYNRAGLVVLDQIGRYVNEFHRLYSTHMDFVACYFRPENRFPDRVFGNVARKASDPKICSLDPFAYFHYRKTFAQRDLSGSWTLATTQPEDLLELKTFYEHGSNGLMLNAIDLDPDMIDQNDLNSEYQRLGLKRERHLFSLKKDGELKAVIMINVSDIGLNKSNLTNCIHVIVLDQDNLSRDTLYLILSILSEYYEQDDIPILLYPFNYAESQSIPYDKIYNLWVLNLQYLDHYFACLENLLNCVKPVST